MLAGVLLFLGANGFFLTFVVLPSEAAYVSAVSVLLFSLPAMWATKMWLGRRDAVLLWVILGIYAIFVETYALATGFPYGEFAYSNLLGFKLFGLTPWTVAFAWTPLVLASHCVAKRVNGDQGIVHSFLRIVLGMLLLVALDLVIDPGAVRVGFWRYEGGGVYYGVPFSNFVGWVMSGAVAMAIVEVFLLFRKPLLPEPAQLISSASLSIALWTAAAGFASMWWPFGIGVTVLIELSIFYLKAYHPFDDMIVYVDEDRRPIGTSPKLAAHDTDTKLHSAFSVFLFNDRGELLLQQRALDKKTWPGVWSNSCCGHVMLHESVVHAARRRVRDELGIRVEQLDVVLPDFRYRAEKDGVVENEICPVLVGFIGCTVRPNADEVNDIRWVKWGDFVRDAADPSNGFSPWAIEEVELLAANREFSDRIGELTLKGKW